VCSIPIPVIGLPPVIRDKYRMRFYERPSGSVQGRSAMTVATAISSWEREEILFPSGNPSRRNANSASLARIRSRISIIGGHHENRNVASLVSSVFLYLRPDLLVLDS
jgi:hypothetical protein